MHWLGSTGFVKQYYKKWIRPCVLILFYLQFPRLTAQMFNVTGSAQQISGSNAFQLTLPQGNERGAVWCTDSIGLSNSFSIEAYLNFGVRDVNGADGMAFVMQTLGSNTVGNHGGGMGYEGYSPSIVIEFDTYQNITDPAYDHIAIHLNGNIFHGVAGCIAGPVPLDTGYANVEDGNDHLVRIQWDAKLKTISVYFNCLLRLRQRIEVDTVFNNGKPVYWGFTSGTGTHFNIHKVIFGDNAFSAKSFEICPGDTVVLTAPASVDGKYSWQPSGGVSKHDIRSPFVSPAVSSIYTVTYTDLCGEPVTDTFDVSLSAVQKPDLGNDTILCGTDSLLLKPGGTYSAYRWHDGTANPFYTASADGFVWLEVLTEGGCMYGDTIHISFREAIELNLGADTAVCAASGFMLSGPEGMDAYLWNDGSTGGSLPVNRSGVYILTIRDSSFCPVSDTIRVTVDPGLFGKELYLPNAFSPDANGINETFPDPVPYSGNYYELKIFSRWGEMLFVSTTPEHTWNGSYRGSTVAAGVYLYMLSYTGCDGKGHSEYGTVTLLE